MNLYINSQGELIYLGFTGEFIVSGIWETSYPIDPIDFVKERLYFI